VALEPLAGVAIGVDFDHDHVKVAVADLTHKVLATRDRDLDVDADGARALDSATTLVREALADTGVPDEHVVGVGMSLPAPVEPSTGIVRERNILPGWESIEPVVELRSRLGLAVLADNDANLGALAEATLGAGRGSSDLCFMQVRSGIGVGLFLGGRIYRGTAGLAGEFGHVSVVEDGPLCGCGNRGCLQQVASVQAILRDVHAARRPQRTIEDVIDAARSGDRPCRRVLADAGRHIGDALAAICNLLNPELVILGGELREAGTLVLEPAWEQLQRRALASVAASVQVVAGQLGADAEVLGALARVLLSTDDHLVMRLTAVD
jgi:predicted NBD/HSP70 family sugar kinase